MEWLLKAFGSNISRDVMAFVYCQAGHVHKAGEIHMIGYSSRNYTRVGAVSSVNGDNYARLGINEPPKLHQSTKNYPLRYSFFFIFV